MKKTEKLHITRNFTGVTIIGVGGTGSYLAEGLAKMVAGYRLGLDVCLVDPDVVEEKNIYRQNFMEYEVGMSKADALGERLNMRYGVRFSSVADKFPTNGLHGYGRLHVGCVDNIESRREFAQLDRYLDCGNGLDFGQVVYGNTTESSDLKEELDDWEKTPSVRYIPHPALVLDFENWTPSPSHLSCADHPFSEQGCYINNWVADAALNILHQLLIAGTLRTPMIAVNFAQGRMVPNAITPTYMKNYTPEKENNDA